MSQNKTLKRVTALAGAPVLCLIVLLYANSIGWARGGFYQSTKHGNPTNGVQRDPSLPPGDCAQCHSMHGVANVAFDFALWVADDNKLCYTCHFSRSPGETFRDSVRYEQSIHWSDFLARWPGPEPAARMEPDARGKCVNCHTPHGWSDTQGLIPSLLFKRADDICLGCHRLAGPAQKQLEVPMTYLYKHQLINSPQNVELHKAGEEMIPTTFSGQNRHMECADCHNVHVLTEGLHTQGTNRASGELAGISFVEATYSGAPDTFPSFQPKDATFDIAFEYQLCFKCHSYWAYGTFPPVPPSGGGQETDPSIEFNPNNISSHNVIQTPNLNGAGEFVNGWQSNSMMTCSDCHGSNVQNDPAGPHASQLQYIIKAPWNVKTGQRTENTSTHLCFLCHDFTTYDTAVNNRNTAFSANSGAENLHGFHAQQNNVVANRPIACMDCHDAIPHGINRMGLLVTTSDPPRLLGGTVLLKQSDVPNWGPPFNWSKTDCTVQCHI